MVIFNFIKWQVMFKVYQKYIIKKILIKYINISLIFFSLIFILGVLDEINFFKDYNSNFFLPYFITFLNIPIVLFEIFPFIILLTTQFFIYDLFKNNELILLKKNGLSNFKIIKIIFFITICIGVFNVVIYYNIAAKMKFFYSDLKNSISKDNKYLAMVTESGLWIKDEINNKQYIIKSKVIDNNLLYENVINEFSSDFKLLRTIQSKKIDIKNNLWTIYDPTITIENDTIKINGTVNFISNFNSKKINNLFANITSFDIYTLNNLKKDYEKLGYSIDEIELQFLKLLTVPLFYGVMSLFSSIIIFNFSKNKSILLNIALGVLISVFIYYFNFIFHSLGNNGKIPVYLSVFFPLCLIFISSLIGLINLNEK